MDGLRAKIQEGRLEYMEHVGEGQWMRDDIGLFDGTGWKLGGQRSGSGRNNARRPQLTK